MLQGLRSSRPRPAITVKTRDDLAAWVQESFGVRIPDKAVCPGHVAPFEAFCSAYFAEHPICIWHASRGFGGKTFLLATLTAAESAKAGANVSLLGGSGEQAERIHEYLGKLWAHPNAPRHLLVSDPTARRTRFTAGNYVRALTASQKSVRGLHPERLRFDEIDEADISIVNAALGQTMSRPGVPAQTVFSSTRQYSDGTMTEMLRRAATGGWPIYEWCWRETVEPHGWLPMADVERKRMEIPADMWEAEIENQEPHAGGRAIQPKAVDTMFDPGLGVAMGDNGEYLEFEKPVKGARYAHGADWAKTVNWTVITTIRYDVAPARVVAFERLGRMEWDKMTARLDARVKRYGGNAAHDHTGLGTVVASMFRVPVEDIDLVGRTRSQLFSDYVAAIEQGDVKSPRIEFAYREHKFCLHGDLASGHGRGHPPDSIVAGALAWHVVGNAPNLAAVPFGVGAGRSYWRDE